MAIEAGNCELCGHGLEILTRPIKRLRWTRHLWQGVASLFRGPLRICNSCGAMYSERGELLAAGAVQTEFEQTLDKYRKDMSYVRDSFGGVVVASEMAVIWLIAGAPANVGGAVLAAAIGVVALAPFGFFWRKVQLAKQDLRQLKKTRTRGQPNTGTPG